MSEHPELKSATVGVSRDNSSDSPHPSRNLSSRAQGYGVAAGYERPYRGRTAESNARQNDEYGPIPDSGYYGSGDSERPFKRGQAGYNEELLWYPPQYGEVTSGDKPTK